MKKLLLCFLILSGMSVSALEVGDIAPCIELDNLNPDGSTITECITNRDHENDYLLLELMSVRCGYCIKNMPIIAQLSQEIAEVATTRMVSVDRNMAQVDAFLVDQREHILYPFAFDRMIKAKKAYGIRYVPTIFVIGPEDQIVYKHIGMLDNASISEIKQIIGL